ncbi:hypothetical protein R1sor_023102 [Riccia sorocarpa]|uniref:BLOC-1-related complex subunit 7 n=1 Tax=Riccia sorocarpa TaxID=122646 RepID=A0ABD3GNI1_9MARC
MASTAKTTAPATNLAAKTATAERLVQIVNSTAQIMRQLKDSSHSAVISQLPKELQGKAANIKNTGKLLYQMPAVVVAMDSHMDNALSSASHLGKLKDSLMTEVETKDSPAS